MRPINAEYSYLNVTASTTAARKQLIAAASGLRHRVIGMTVAALGAQQITLQASTTGLPIYGPVHVAAGVPLVLPPSPLGYCETAAGKALYNQSDNATATIIALTYQTYKAT